MASQESVASTASFPPEIIENQDIDFVDEITNVDNLYFANTETYDPSSVYEIGESDSDNDDNSEAVGLDVTPGPGAGDVAVTQRIEDHNEAASVYDFRINGCACTKIYGHPCSKEIVWDRLLDYRNCSMEYSREELNLVIKVQLLGHRHSGVSTDSKKHKTKERERAFQEYFLFGRQVCQKTFCFAHAIGVATLKRIATHLDSHGLSDRVHGNKGKSPQHAMTVNDINNVITFLHSYANKNGLPLPGRMPNYRDTKVILLPSDKSKADIFEMYNSTATELGFRLIALSTFKKLWLEHCPTLLIIKPATDLCSKCQLYSVKLSNGGNETEEEKLEDLRKYNDHISKAKLQRDYYRSQVEAAKEQYTALPEEKKQRGQPTCSLSGIQHYSFDYAQQVHYPHYAQQVGPIFFKTPRRCQCFGVCSEGSGSQVFYLVDEADHKGKGANTVTSFLHHHFEHHGYGEQHVQLHMDNCSGQNKNNTVIWYGLWRVLTGQHMSVEFSSMEVGHTKFHPDWHFGLWKAKWRHSTAETMEQVAETVTHSSRNGHNIPQLVTDPEKPVIFYEWTQFLSKYFRKIPSLLTYHHFKCSIDKPGSIMVREYASDQEKEIKLLKAGVNICASEQPCITVNPGLDAARMWYLYEEIRPYCPAPLMDKVCPRPSVPKPQVVIKCESKTLSKKKSRYCHN